MYSSMMEYLALRRSVGFMLAVAAEDEVLVPVESESRVEATASMSDHLLALLRPGAESHFLRRAVVRALLLL